MRKTKSSENISANLKESTNEKELEKELLGWAKDMNDGFKEFNDWDSVYDKKVKNLNLLLSLYNTNPWEDSQNTNAALGEGSQSSTGDAVGADDQGTFGFRTGSVTRSPSPVAFEGGPRPGLIDSPLNFGHYPQSTQVADDNAHRGDVLLPSLDDVEGDDDPGNVLFLTDARQLLAYNDRLVEANPRRAGLVIDWTGRTRDEPDRHRRRGTHDACHQFGGFGSPIPPLSYDAPLILMDEGGAGDFRGPSTSRTHGAYRAPDHRSSPRPDHRGDAYYGPGPGGVGRSGNNYSPPHFGKGPPSDSLPSARNGTGRWFQRHFLRDPAVRDRASSRGSGSPYPQSAMALSSPSYRSLQGSDLIFPMSPNVMEVDPNATVSRFKSSPYPPPTHSQYSRRANRCLDFDQGQSGAYDDHVTPLHRPYKDTKLNFSPSPSANLYPTRRCY